MVCRRRAHAEPRKSRRFRTRRWITGDPPRAVSRSGARENASVIVAIERAESRARRGGGGDGGGGRGGPEDSGGGPAGCSGPPPSSRCRQLPDLVAGAGCAAGVEGSAGTAGVAAAAAFAAFFCCVPLVPSVLRVTCALAAACAFSSAVFAACFGAARPKSPRIVGDFEEHGDDEPSVRSDDQLRLRTLVAVRPGPLRCVPSLPRRRPSPSSRVPARASARLFFLGN